MSRLPKPMPRRGKSVADPENALEGIVLEACDLVLKLVRDRRWHAASRVAAHIAKVLDQLKELEIQHDRLAEELNNTAGREGKARRGP